MTPSAFNGNFALKGCRLLEMTYVQLQQPPWLLQAKEAQKMMSKLLHLPTPSSSRPPHPSVRPVSRTNSSERDETKNE